MIRRRAVLAALVAAFAIAGVVGIPGSGVAHAAGPHRAMVVVDTGATTYQKVISFDGDSITGIQALQLASAEPVVYSFSGQGGAVCRLFGVGRDAGPNCLGGADGDNRYWAYFRAPSGTSSFTYSRAGGGSTQVHDGDVEGWKFGTGTAPAWSPVPPDPATTTTTAAAPPLSNPPPTGTAPAGTAPTGTAPTLAAGATPEQIAAFNAALGATTTSTVVPGTAEVRANRATRQATRSVASGRVAGATDSPDSKGGGGSAGSLALFAIVAVALGGGGVLLRRSRRHAS